MREARSWTHGWSCAVWLMFGCGGDALDYGGCEDCEPDVAAVDCRDGDTYRSPRTPAAEAVKITEWMANPRGSDAELEWIEVSFATDADLYAVQLGPTLEELHDAVAGPDCVPVGAGSRIVFGASPAAAPRVDVELPFSLSNSGPRGIVLAEGGRLLDRVEYDRTVEGVAWQVDPNDVVCEASVSYSPENSGTPGAPNQDCPVVLSPDQCLDDGNARAIVLPQPGEAVISEWMADPDAVANHAGEWVEVRFGAAADANGLTLSDLGGAQARVESETCIAVPAGGHVVFARKLDPLENGGVERVVAPLSLSLNNRDEQLTLRTAAQVLDAISYDSAQAGVATQVDETGRVCAAMEPYGEGDLGTPGAPNPSCF